MFTGIVTDMGRVRQVEQTARDRRYALQKAELETLQKDVDERIATL